jgi:hypothetical protein
MDRILQFSPFQKSFVSTSLRALLFLLLSSHVVVVTSSYGQDFILTAVVLINSQSSAGYNPNPQNPGAFQRFTERYLEHLQVPYELFDVATQAPPDLSQRQLIISGHPGLDLSSAWRSAITNAVAGGVGFVNLDWSSTVGQQSHIQTMLGATGSSQGTAGSTITIPQAVLQDGASPHYIAGLQRRFRGDPSGDIVYAFHADTGGTLRTITSTILTGASGTVIASVGANPLILATTYQLGRVVHFGTLEYLRADRFGFFMGLDDLFWRSLVWAARKPFVVRGYPRLWAVQMDDTLPAWPSRVRDLYDTSLTGSAAPDGTGGPWRVTGYVFTDNLVPGSADRAAVIADVNAGQLQISPHSRNGDYGTLYWQTPDGVDLTETSWLNTLADIEAWRVGNGGTDELPFLSRSIVGHFWNLSDIIGYDLWNTLGVRYITAIQRPGIDFYSKTDADRLRLGPFRTYELPPSNNPDENYPIYLADSYTINSRSGLPSQSFFALTTQIIDLVRYDRQDLAWPNADRPVEETVDQFQYYTWRLWSSQAPVQIYTHDGSSNMILSTVSQRRQVVQQVSQWLNERGVRHVFMEDLGDYMYARTQSVLIGAEAENGEIILTFTGDAATPDNGLLTTELLFFNGDNEGIAMAVPGFIGGSIVTLPFPTNANPTPLISAIDPDAAAAGGSGFTLTVTGNNFIPDAVVRWDGEDRPTTFISATELRANIPAADVETGGTVGVTVFNPAPGGGLSNSLSFAIILTPTSTFVDDFNRADNASLGNGWIEKTPAAFALSNNRVSKASTSTGYLDNLVYRPGTENMLDVEASVEVRLLSLPPGYPQVFVRGQTATIADVGRFSGYLLFIDNAADRVILSRIADSAFVPLAQLNLNPPLNTTDIFRLRLRATETDPVRLEAFVERLSGTTWEIVAQATYADADATRFTTAGTVGFSGYVEGGLYTYDNFTRLGFDAGGSGNPAPSISQLVPDSATAGGPAFTLTINGSGFITSSVVRWNGADRSTVFRSTTQLEAAISSADIATVGTATVTVFTPEPGGGTSNGLSFQITAGGGSNPLPVLTGLQPTSATAGGPAFTLTALGSEFVADSVVRWNGANRPTTYVSATELQADIAAADIATAGTALVTVFTPTPGGGTSTALSFAIVGAGSGDFFDDFNRADSGTVGNGWVEKTAAAFALAGEQVTKAATGTGYADNLVYRPTAEALLDGEASLEVRFNSLPPGYPQLFVRAQAGTIANAGAYDGYLLFIDNAANRALLDRIEAGVFIQLASMTLNPQLNTTDTFRLRLRATGTSPVRLEAYVERLNGTTWDIIGQATVNDAAATRFATAGTVGFSAHTEGGLYTYDNFTRTDLD